jgi:CHRD domain
MRKLILCLALLMSVSTIPMAVADNDPHNQSHRVRARLSGFNEVHFSGGPPATLRGAISTGARGTFVAMIDTQDRVIDYELSYQDLESDVTQGHIHFGQQHTVGGIVVWLCQTEGTRAPPPVDSFDVTPLCPEREGTVTGTITPAKVLAQTAQGFSAGDFDELVRAIRAGATYANVHSEIFTPGEIRGQIARRQDD